MSKGQVIERKYLVEGPHSEVKMEKVDSNIQTIISGGTNKFTYDTVMLKPYARAYLGITYEPEERFSENKTTYDEEWREIKQGHHKISYPEEYLGKPDTFYLLYKDESPGVVESYERIFLDKFSGFIDADKTEGEAGREGKGGRPCFLYLFLQHYVR